MSALVEVFTLEGVMPPPIAPPCLLQRVYKYVMFSDL